MVSLLPKAAHVFDLSLAVRGRRRALKLRQGEVAKGAGVGREWLCDFEHGKPTAEVGHVLKVLLALGIEINLEMAAPPDWTRPLTEAAVLRKQRLDALRPKGRAHKPRRDVIPPADYDKWEEWHRRGLG